MRLVAWWQGDPIPQPAHTIEAAQSTDIDFLSRICRLSRHEVGSRLKRGHLAWVVRRDDEVVGWTWLATRSADASEAPFSLRIADRQAFAWGTEADTHESHTFVLQAVMRAVAGRFDQVWMIERCGEAVAQSAGLRGVDGVKLGANGAIWTVPGELDHRGSAALEMLSLPMP